MMFLPRLYARLCARQAGRTLLANRITQNYSLCAARRPMSRLIFCIRTPMS